MFPLFVQLAGRLAVVVGAGPVGMRKVRSLLSAQAHVRVICLEPRPTDMQGESVEWITSSYQASFLNGACLVFACANTDVNTQVVQDAKVHGIWVNRADLPEQGDFLVPATLRQGDLTLAISTGGAAPALARRIRQFLEQTFDSSFADWVILLEEMRSIILEQIAEASLRRDLLLELSEWYWLDGIRNEGMERTRQRMLMLLQSKQNP